jgi:hypothetical protein
MSRPPITFRLTEHECQLLEYARQDGESINQTASRLLRERLGIREEISSTFDEHTLDTVINEKVNAKVENLKMWIETLVNTNVNNQVNERLNEIKTQPPKRGRPPKTTVTELDV